MTLHEMAKLWGEAVSGEKYDDFQPTPENKGSRVLQHFIELRQRQGIPEPRAREVRPRSLLCRLLGSH